MDKGVKELLHYLQEVNAVIRIDNGNLKIDAAKGVVTPEIAAQIRAHKDGILEYVRSREKSDAIQPVTGLAHYELSSGQKRLWVLAQDPETSVRYNLAGAYKIDGDLDAVVLGKAWMAVVAKHEVLRTVFAFHEGELFQQILAPETESLLLQFPDLESIWSQEAIESHILADANAVIDLENGPLVSAAFFHSEKVFYYKIHHIIADGWSMNVLWNDLMSAYRQLAAGLPCEDRLKTHYKDFAHWQNAALSTGKMDGHKAFWKETLSGDLPILKLPFKGDSSKGTESTTGIVSAVFPEKLSAALQQFAKQENSTVFTALIASLNVLLYRYTDQTDIILGTPVSGRAQFELDNQIGLYINTVVLRNAVNCEEGFQSFFQHVKQQTLQALAHQTYPYDQIVSDLEMGGNSLFNVFIDYQHQAEDAGEVATSGLQISPFGAIDELAKFDLTVAFIHSGNNITLRLIYNAERFDELVMQQFAAHFIRLSQLVLSQPEIPLKALPLLSVEEVSELLEGYNSTAFEHDLAVSCIDRFKEMAARFPGHIALKFRAQSMTYRELDAQSNRVAHYLIDHGVGMNDCVALAMHPSIDRMVTIFGIVKAGAAYLPLGVDYPKNRIEQIAESSQYKFLLSDRESAQQLEVETLLLETILDEEQRTEAVNRAINPDSLAYIIYTSGSTGNPKGVMIDHKALVNRIEWMQHAYPITENDAILHKTVYTFDVSVWELFWFATRGATLSILPGGDEKLPDRIIAQIEGDQVNVMHFVPAMLNGFLTYCEAVNVSDSLASLRYVFASGEELKGTYANRFNAFFEGKNARLINLYGPTEATIDVTFFDCLPGKAYHAVPIGKPVHNTQLYVLDSHKNLMPKGCMGELYLGGIQVSSGYLNDPERTAAAFIDSPFEKGEKLYKTGDLTKWNAQGEMEYHGRVDHQVKIRGFRIELGDIENALERMPAVSSAAVKVIVQQGINTGLVGYVTTNQRVSAQEIQLHLKQELPEYMIPSNMVFLDEMPLSNNGKINRKALPSWEETEELETIIPLETERELLLAEIWRSVLKTENLGKNSNFYQLGGDSIKSILIASKLRQAGYFMKIPDILAFPLLAMQSAKMEAGTTAIDQQPVSGTIPLGAIQEDFLNDSLEDKHHFNQSILLESSEVIDEDRLHAAITALIRHHDSLRATYTQDSNGKWSQVILDAESMAFEIETIECQSPEALDEQLGVFQAGFQLSQAPLFRAVIAKVAGKNYLSLMAHHLVVDGVSWRILLEDLGTAYRQSESGTVELPLKTHSLKAWLENLALYSQSEALTPQLGYWQSELAKEVTTLPVDNAHGSNCERDSALLAFSLTETETTRLFSKIHLIGAEMNAVLLTALAGAFKQKFNSLSTRVFLEGHGREQIGNMDVSRTTGWFTTVFPVVIDAVGEDLVIDVKKTGKYLKGIPMNGLGYGLLKQNQRIEEQDEHKLLFNYLGDIGGDMQSEEVGAFQLSALPRGQETSLDRLRDAELEFSGMIVNKQLQFTVIYSNQRWNKETIESIQDAFKQQLQQMGNHFSAINKSPFTFLDTHYPLDREQFSKLSENAPLRQVYPMNSLQQGIFYHWLMDKTAMTYVCQSSYKIKGNLQPELLKQALEQCMELHDVLRSHFTAVTGELLQVVKEKVEVPFEFIYLIGKEYDLKALAQVERQKAFDLEGGCQLRLSVMQLEEDVFAITWTYHHIIMDGWSLGLLVNQFNDIYLNLAQNKSAILSPYKYVDYLHWVDHFDPIEATAFWKSHLLGVSNKTGIPLPMKDRYAGPSYENAEVHQPLGAALSQRLIDFCRTEQITTNAFFQLVWGIVLSNYHQQSDVVYGLIHSGRPAEVADIDKFIGLFIDLNPVRLQLDPSLSLKALAARVHKQLIDVQPHQYLGYNAILKSAGLAGDQIDHVLLFQNYHIEQQESAPESDQLAILSQDSVEQTNYNLVVSVFQSGDYHVNFEFNAAAYAMQDVEALAAKVTALVQQIVEQPDQSSDWLVGIQHAASASPQGMISHLEADSLISSPATETEKSIHDVWASVLQKDEVSADADFFVVGGDSILTIKTVVLINQQLRCTLEIADLYKFRTIRTLAQYIDQGTLGAANVSAKMQQKLAIAEKWNALSEKWLQNYADSHLLEDTYPMSEVEKGMLYDSMVGAEGTYHIQSVFQISGSIDHEAFSKAIDELIAKHAILRTEYVLDPELGGLHLIHKNLSPQFRFEDLSEMDKEAQAHYLANHLSEERKNPFGWGMSPLWRMDLYRNNSDGHTFIWQVHHALMDGWSSQLFFEELYIVYTSIVSGAPQALQPLNGSYKDAVLDQLVIEQNAETADFWKSYLQGFEPSDLFEAKNAELYERHITWSEKESEELKQFAAASGKTVKSVVLAAYFSALSNIQYSGDTVIGIVTNTRPTTLGSDRLLGCFLNTIPIRMTTSSRSPGLELIERVDQEITESKAFDKYPTGKIWKESGLISSEKPMMELLFNYNDFTRIAGDEATSEKEESNLAGFSRTNSLLDLSVENGKKITFSFAFNRTVKCLGGNDAFLSNYFAALNQMISGSVREVETVAQEVVELEDCYNRFESVAAQFSSKVALVSENKTFAYSEVLDLVRQWSTNLVHAGIKPGDIVAVDCDNRAWNAIALLSLMRAGAVYLPIDPKLPEARKSFMVQDSDAKFAIVDGTASNAYDSLQVISLTDLNKETETVEIERPHHGSAYLIYTSGTTGKPKGVLLNGDGLVNLSHLFEKEWNVCPNDRIVQFASPSFDASVWEYAMALLTGASLHIPSEAQIHDPQLFTAYLVDHQITVMTLPPVFVQNLKHSPEMSLRLLVTAGSAPQTELVRNWIDHVDFINAYGPTETSICASYYALKKGSPVPDAIPIGRAIPNYKVLVLNHEQQPVIPGATGEIVILGCGLAQGYINRESLTEQHFIELSGGSKAYRSGDFGYWDENQNLVFAGRKDDQVKIRGYRIEIREIESSALAMGNIAQVGAFVHDQQLYLLYVSDIVTAASLKEKLGEELPQYMVPAYIFKAEELPVSVSGKLDVARSLQYIQQVRSSANRFAKQAETAIELKIAEIWKDLLKVSDIDIQLNFFDAGGDSIKLMQLHKRLQEALEIQFPLVFLFQHASIQSMAAFYQQQTTTGADRSEALTKGRDNRNKRRELRTKIES